MSGILNGGPKVYLVGSENEYQFYSRFLQATHTDAQVTTQGGASTISSQVLEERGELLSWLLWGL